MNKTDTKLLACKLNEILVLLKDPEAHKRSKLRGLARLIERITADDDHEPINLDNFRHMTSFEIASIVNDMKKCDYCAYYLTEKCHYGSCVSGITKYLNRRVGICEARRYETKAKRAGLISEE